MTEIQKLKLDIETMLKTKKLQNKRKWKRKYQTIIDNARSDVELFLDLTSLASSLADTILMDLQK